MTSSATLLLGVHASEVKFFFSYWLNSSAGRY
jgi:hypothetical protein